MAQRILPMVNIEKLYMARLIKEELGKATYDTPVFYEGIKELGFKIKQNKDSYYHEGRKILDEMSLADMNVTINITDLDEKQESYLLGHKLAEGGGIIRNANDIAPEVAILFKANKSEGIDRFEVLYAARFQEPDFDVKDKEGKINFQSLKLEAGLRPLATGDYNFKVDTDSEGVTDVAKLESKFFASVMQPKATEEVTGNIHNASLNVRLEDGLPQSK